MITIIKLKLASDACEADEVESVTGFINDHIVLIFLRQRRHDLIDVEIENAFDLLEFVFWFEDDFLCIGNEILDEMNDLWWRKLQK